MMEDHTTTVSLYTRSTSLGQMLLIQRDDFPSLLPNEGDTTIINNFLSDK